MSSSFSIYRSLESSRWRRSSKSWPDWLDTINTYLLSAVPDSWLVTLAVVRTLHLGWEVGKWRLVLGISARHQCFSRVWTWERDGAKVAVTEKCSDSVLCQNDDNLFFRSCQWEQLRVLLEDSLQVSVLILHRSVFTYLILGKPASIPCIPTRWNWCGCWCSWR